MYRRLVLAVFAGVSLYAGEGKWTPQQVLQLDPAWLKQQGLELPPQRLWDPARGTGLLAATVGLPGCSGSFISGTGLIVTNHHCAFSILQQHSTPQNDIITNGFLARTAAQELPGATMRITVPKRFVDVTREVEGSIPAGSNDRQRHLAIEAKRKQLIAACEQQKATRCNVEAFDGGIQYIQAEMTELSDVRLVYAPPRWVGEYGGEDDNFHWPRHAGDFAILRAYVAPDGSPARFQQSNVAYKPEFFFPLATKGVAPGDFVMILGYPGLTFRSFTAAEMAVRRDLFYPQGVDIYTEWTRLLEEAGKSDAQSRIAVAATLKSLYNRLKNYQGQIEGFQRGRLLEKQQQAEEEVLTWARRQPKYRSAVDAREALLALVGEQRSTWDRDFLLQQSTFGPRALYLITTLVRSADERQKPDLERDTLFMERNLPRLRDQIEREQKNYSPAADQALFASFVRRALALPPQQRIAAVDAVFAKVPESQRQARIAALYRDSKVLTASERLKMAAETPEQLRARHDPLLDFGFQLESDLRALREKQERWQGAISRLRPEWRGAVIAHAGKPVAPDANSTLRVSFGHVKGYAPRDAVVYTPQTTLRGMMEKQTGQEPFIVPEEIQTAIARKKYGPWKDEKLGDVPVDFLSDVDTTGGNSGSPMVNGRGEFVGANFDRVWENVANDFGYNPEIARNVSADVRYLLWMLDQVSDAAGLLRELGIRNGSAAAGGR